MYPTPVTLRPVAGWSGGGGRGYLQQVCCRQAYRKVFTASPARRNPARAAESSGQSGILIQGQWARPPIQAELHGSKSDKALSEKNLLERITINPEIFSGKPIIRGRRLAVEHVLGQLAAGDDFETLLEGYPWLEREDILACLAYAHRLVEHERVEPVRI
jgi:uncharacterized protein (DUF433 family)